MIIRGVLLGTLEEQTAGGDKQPIDPASCPLEPVGQPVTVNFRRDQQVGTVTRLWLEDGRVMFQAEVHPERDLPRTATVGGTMNHSSKSSTMKTSLDLRPIKMIDLFAIGLTDTPIPTNQPPYEIVEE